MIPALLELETALEPGALPLLLPLFALPAIVLVCEVYFKFKIIKFKSQIQVFNPLSFKNGTF